MRNNCKSAKFPNLFMSNGKNSHIKVNLNKKNNSEEFFRLYNN